MAKFVANVRFTPEGRQNILATCDRAASFTDSVAELGVSVRELLWSQGPYDGVIVFDAPSDEVAAAAMFKLGSEGNVTTETSRAYDAYEIRDVLTMLP
ncbi:MAG: GYD domain-containing protein [Planctomycetales bacterium]|nr:GYD domain-containing protein [Planctomycetales bacterium]